MTFVRPHSTLVDATYILTYASVFPNVSVLGRFRAPTIFSEYCNTGTLILALWNGNAALSAEVSGRVSYTEGRLAVRCKYR
jgi:hypothetical protein